jgi:hypothetical protein
LGAPKDPDYWIKWRAAHPDYRDRERKRARSRTPEQRRAEKERAKAKARAAAAKSKSQKYQRDVKPWREAHPDLFHAQQRRANARLYERDPERMRAYRRAAEKRARERHYIALATRAVAGIVSRDQRSELNDCLYEDALSEAFLSLVENRWRRGKDFSEDEWVAAAREAAVARVREQRRYWFLCAYDFLDEAFNADASTSPTA